MVARIYPLTAAPLPPFFPANALRSTVQRDDLLEMVSNGDARIRALFAVLAEAEADDADGAWDDFWDTLTRLILVRNRQRRAMRNNSNSRK